MTPQGLRELVEGDPLNDNEVELLLRAAQGESAKATAEAMNYADDTIKTMRKYAIAKLGAKNITHAVGIALARGIINPDHIEPLD
jgi:Response regulator containing a CheY-like receiver domain and an HTH DNA-binding domain